MPALRDKKWCYIAKTFLPGKIVMFNTPQKHAKAQQAFLILYRQMAKHIDRGTDKVFSKGHSVLLITYGNKMITP